MSSCKHRYAKFQDGKRRCVMCKEEFTPLPFVELVQALIANAEAADREDKPYTAAVYRSALLHIERGLDARTGLETRREHVESADCWCSPTLDYLDAETGRAVYVHHKGN